MVIKVVLPVREVPEGSIVTKRTGQLPLTVCREMVIFGPDKNQQQRIKPEEGVVFLLDGRRNISAVHEDTEVVWETDHEELMEFLSNCS